MHRESLLEVVTDKVTKDIEKFTEESENLKELLAVQTVSSAEKINIKYLLIDNKNIVNSYKKLYESINKLEKFNVKKSYSKIISSLDYICANVKSDTALEIIDAIKTDGKAIKSKYLEEFNNIIKDVKNDVNKAFYKDEVKTTFLTAINKYVQERKKEIDIPLTKYKHKVKNDVVTDKETAKRIIIEIDKVLQEKELKNTIHKLNSIRLKQEKIINKSYE